MKPLSYFAIIAAMLMTSQVLAGTVEGTVNLIFEQAYPLIQEALNIHYGDEVFIPYKGEGKSIDLKRDDYDYWDYENYKKYVLPAYIYSTEAEARTFYIINVRESDPVTIITLSGFWEIETNPGWLKVESNNENEAKFLKYLIQYCQSPR